METLFSKPDPRTTSFACNSRRWDSITDSKTAAVSATGWIRARDPSLRGALNVRNSEERKRRGPEVPPFFVFFSGRGVAGISSTRTRRSRWKHPACREGMRTKERRMIERRDERARLRLPRAWDGIGWEQRHEFHDQPIFQGGWEVWNAEEALPGPGSKRMVTRHNRSMLYQRVTQLCSRFRYLAANNIFPTTFLFRTTS